MAASPEGMRDEPSTTSGVIRAVRTRPGRVVFTTDGLPDAWIASDVLEELPP